MAAGEELQDPWALCSPSPPSCSDPPSCETAPSFRFFLQGPHVVVYTTVFPEENIQESEALGSSLSPTSRPPHPCREAE